MNYLLLLFLLIAFCQSELVREDRTRRLFVKPLELITLDVMIDEDYTLFIEDLNANTKYAVTLSYPGVYPVQYTVFLEQEEEEYSSYDYKRRIQDTRLFSFETDENGDIVKEDENGEMIRYLPIMHIQPHHVIDSSHIDHPSNRYVAIIIEPISLGLTPTTRSEAIAILFILFIVLCCITLFYTNPSFRASIQSILCIQQKDD